jgi:type 1 glutamine amidotransferase
LRSSTTTIGTLGAANTDSTQASGTAAVNTKIDATPTAVQAGHAGEMVPQVWTYERTLFGGQPYRGFVWMQGHNYSNFAHAQIQPMLLRGIAWAAKYPTDALATDQAAARGAGAGRGAGRGGN